jgi:intein-encoded DNA endonuclease-like protein
MRINGLSCSAIAREIERTEGVRLDVSQVCSWIHGGHSPMGRVKQFAPAPSPELAYVVGVKLGDASLGISRYNYNIKLRVIDLDFAREFSRCLCTILQREIYEPRWMKSFDHWYVCASSMLLYRYLSGPLASFKKMIEHDEVCASAFVRGFFDSEGSASGKELGVANTNLEVLEYVKSLLLHGFTIACTGPRLVSQRGGTKMIKGKLWRVNKDCYYLRVRRASIYDFSLRIGFSIERKNRALKRGIESRTRGP